MRLLLKIEDTEFLFTPEQASALVAVLAETQVHERKYQGSTVPEGQRWKRLLSTPNLPEALKFSVMDDVSYAALVAVTRIHHEAEANKA